MMKQTRIPHVLLVVEQDRVEREVLTCKLREAGHFVLAVADAEMALEAARNNPLSLILLDAALVAAHDYELCRQLHASQATGRLPILLLVTEKSELLSLRRSEVPVEDYIVKPLLWEEVDACVRTLLRWSRRRVQPRPVKVSRRPIMEAGDTKEVMLIADDLRIDLARRRVVRQGQPIEIGKALLFELLVYLVRHRGIVLTPGQLLTQVWGYTDASVNAVTSRTIYVHVHWLRELLEDHPDHPQLIQTVRGVGYRFRD